MPTPPQAAKWCVAKAQRTLRFASKFHAPSCEFWTVAALDLRGGRLSYLSVEVRTSRGYPEEAP